MLSDNARLRGWDCGFLSKRDDEDAFMTAARYADAVFNTIDDAKTGGSASLRYFRWTQEIGIPFINSEKLLFVNHFGEIEPHLEDIGFTTILGGASGMPNLILEGRRKGIVSMKGIVNATLNFICWALSNGHSLKAAIVQAQNQGLCESGWTDPVGIINREITDALYKALIMRNLAGITPRIYPRDLKQNPLSEEQIRRFVVDRTGTRFIVTFDKSGRREGVLNGFSHFAMPWQLTGTFVPEAERSFPVTLPAGQKNCLVVNTEQGVLKPARGIGAGPYHMALAMFDDADNLLEKRMAAA